MFFRHGKFCKKNALSLLLRLMGTCRISYQEKREADEKNRVKSNTFVSILVPYSQPHSTDVNMYTHFTLEVQPALKFLLVRKYAHGRTGTHIERA